MKIMTQEMYKIQLPSCLIIHKKFLSYPIHCSHFSTLASTVFLSYDNGAACLKCPRITRQISQR